MAEQTATAKTADGFQTEPCRSCDAPVIWCQTGKGRAQPVDAEPAPGGYIAVRASAVPGGKPVAERVKPHLAFGRRDLRRAHHETCPQGAAWKRKHRSAS
jgi:hypothetical protein